MNDGNKNNFERERLCEFCPTVSSVCTKETAWRQVVPAKTLKPFLPVESEFGSMNKTNEFFSFFSL
jgi:hypothetical protein